MANRKQAFLPREAGATRIFAPALSLALVVALGVLPSLPAAARHHHYGLFDLRFFFGRPFHHHRHAFHARIEHRRPNEEAPGAADRPAKSADKPGVAADVPLPPERAAEFGPAEGAYDASRDDIASTDKTVTRAGQAGETADVPLPPKRAAEFSAPDGSSDKDARHDDVADAKEARLEAPDVPMPPQRPADLAAPPEIILRPPAESAGDNMALRDQAMQSGELVAEILPPLAAPGGCGIAAPLKLEAVVLDPKTKVEIVPAVTMRPSLALAIADWLREDLEPALANKDKEKDDGLSRVEGIGAYECRTRDSIAGAKLSEHAIGNAFDLHAIVTEKGRHIGVAPSPQDVTADAAFLATMKKTACLRFMTVLGPGSDVFHLSHLHIDLEARRGGAHLCQWNLPEKPTEVAAPAHH